MSKSILLSIHPKWAEKIYSGEKTIEWRKNIPTADFIDKVFLYETAPVCRVTGCFDYNFFYSLAFKNLGLSLCPTANVFIAAGCVPIEELAKYRGDKRELFGWKVKNPKKFDKPKTLADFGLKRPPQSWQYVEVNK